MSASTALDWLGKLRAARRDYDEAERAYQAAKDTLAEARQAELAAKRVLADAMRVLRETLERATAGGPP